MAPMATETRNRLTLGSRRSRLALWQTTTVAEALSAANPRLEYSIRKIDTRGDQVLDQPLPMIGGKGLFTAELDKAIRAGEIDLAVHSLKDLPTEPEPGICTIPVLPREDPRDVLVSKNGEPFSGLPAGAVVGTSSPRRQSQILALRDDVVVRSIRGNVPTRIDKALQGDFDAVVLAAAGVIRMEMTGRVSDWFDFGQILPAPGQGVMAITCRQDDLATQAMLQMLADPPTCREVGAERQLLSALGGGCSTPIAALAECQPDGQIRLTARVASLDGQRVIEVSRTAADPQGVARLVADEILDRGGRALLGLEPSAAANALRGKRILVTRAAEQSSGMCDLLRARGAVPIETPLIRFRPLLDRETARPVLERLGDFDWIVFTSSNAIRFLAELLEDETLPDSTRLACVGQKTAATLADRFRPPDFVPDRYTSKFLARQLEFDPDAKILLPVPRVSNRQFAHSLRQRGAEVVEWPVYETLPVEISEPGRECLQSGVDALVFASPSAVDSFCRQVDGFQDILAARVVACLGPMTRRRARERGIEVAVMPPEFTIPELIDALARHFANEAAGGRHD